MSVLKIKLMCYLGMVWSAIQKSDLMRSNVHMV